MLLDLRRDFADLYAHLAKRVKEFDPATNVGPGEPGPVKLVEFGFGPSWVAVVFDTRPDAEQDGTWSYPGYIEGKLYERTHWEEADEANWDGPVTLIQWDGTEIVLPAGSTLNKPLGELLKAVLLKAREDGLFAGLPKAIGCRVGVDHQDGKYNWPAYEQRGQVNLAEPGAAPDSAGG